MTPLEDNTEGLEWLDLALYFAAKRVDEYWSEGWEPPVTKLEKRRQKRLAKVLNFMPMDRDFEARMEYFSLVVAGWFSVLPDSAREEFNEPLLDAMDRSNRFDRNHVANAANELFRNNDALPWFTLAEQGVVFGLEHIDARNWFAVKMLAPFLAFIQGVGRRGRTFMCHWCGTPFFTKRTDTRFCSPSCRSGGREQEPDDLDLDGGTY